VRTALIDLLGRKTVVGHTYKITPFNLALVGILICILALFGPVYSSNLGAHDVFLDAHVAQAIIASQQTHFDLSTSEYYIPGLAFLLVAVTKLSSLSPVTLEYTPLGTIFVLVATYSLAKRFQPSAYALAACLIASTVLLKAFSTTAYSIWPHTFGFMLFFLFVYLFFELENKQTIETLAALCIVFIGIHLFSYSAELMAISFFLFANVLMFARQKKYRLQGFSLALVFIAIFLAFNQVIYNFWIPKYNIYSSQIASSFTDYLSTILHTAPPTPWLYVSPPPPIEITLISYSWYLATFVPLILAVLYTIQKMVRRRSFSVLKEFTSPTAIVSIAMLLVWVTDATAYALIGGISVALLRYYSLVAPVLIAVFLTYLLTKWSISTTRYHISSIVGGYLVVLLILTAAMLSSSIAYSTTVSTPDRNANLDPTAAWFFNSTHNVSNILGDQNTQAAFCIFRAKQGSQFAFDSLFTVELYGSLVDPTNTTGNGGHPSLLTNQYIVIDLATYTGSTTAAWTNFEPLQPHMGSINTASNLIRIYDDGNAYIIKGL
jgi:hypothetical protein